MSTLLDSAKESVTDGAYPSRHDFHGMRIALLHHWFISLAGGERVIDTIASIFPNADIFALFVDERKLPLSLRERKIVGSFLDKIPGGRRVHRHLLPFYPLAVEMLDLSGYDLVISSDSGPMKGALTDVNATHICYCHSPMRYLWDGYSAYIRGMSPPMQSIFGLTSHYVRNWDYSAAQRVDYFIANSNYVAGRIRKYYRRESTVIHPPINTGHSFLADKHDDYYLAVGRLVPYKRTDILIEACKKLGRRLLIVGDGPEMKRLRKAGGENIEFLGEVDESQLRNVYAQCRALLFAADEDFGMVALEAQSYGRPVICYGKGGSLETVRGAYTLADLKNADAHKVITGIFFEKQTADSLANAILSFESAEDVFVQEEIQSHARKFDTSIFVERLQNYIQSVMVNRIEISTMPLSEGIIGKR
jgi:glycosyltransferase involved in cell wall biosynthesis